MDPTPAQPAPSRRRPQSLGIKTPDLGIKEEKQPKRQQRGSVSIEAYRGYLRLRWRHNGKRFALYSGLPESGINRKALQGKASQIEMDIASGNFDPSLKKYRNDTQQRYPQLSVVALFERFIKWKAKSVTARSLEKYDATLSYLKEHFGEKPAEKVGIPAAEGFSKCLMDKGLSLIVVKERLTLVRAAWLWAIQEKLVESDPWQEVIPRIKVPPKQRPKPFTREEMERIIQAFRTDHYFSYYGDYVEFLFGTGCRTSEAIGLRWNHVSDDCSQVWIGESLTRSAKIAQRGREDGPRTRKATKTNRDRTLTLTPRLQAMIQARKPEKPDPEGLVFTAARGGAIDDHNFRNRAWEPILTRLGIDYRKPYTTRHTLISHALNLGHDPVTVAELTGHDVQTLYENYAGSVNNRHRLPEIL